MYRKRIKEVRRLLKIKQKDMAQKLDVSASYLSSIESETRGANGKLIIRFLNEFDVSSSWLYKGIGPVFNDFDSCVYVSPAVVHEKESGYSIPVPKNYIEKEFSFLSEKLLYYTIENNNMAPTLNMGDIVLVDTTENNIKAEGIYLVKINGVKTLRRLLFTPELNLQFDNETLKNGMILVDSTVEFVGKVVWFGRKI